MLLRVGVTCSVHRCICSRINKEVGLLPLPASHRRWLGVFLTSAAALTPSGGSASLLARMALPLPSGLFHGDKPRYTNGPPRFPLAGLPEIRAGHVSGVGACSMSAEMSQWKLPGIHLTKGDPSLCK